jgi:hypothetical protein
MLTYFAADGNYGDATGLVIVDTSTWDEDTWEAVEAANEWTRPAKALGEYQVKEG